MLEAGPISSVVVDGSVAGGGRCFSRRAAGRVAIAQGKSPSAEASTGARVNVLRCMHFCAMLLVFVYLNATLNERNPSAPVAGCVLAGDRALNGDESHGSAFPANPSRGDYRSKAPFDSTAARLVVAFESPEEANSKSEGIRRKILRDVRPDGMRVTCVGSRLRFSSQNVRQHTFRRKGTKLGVRAARPCGCFAVNRQSSFDFQAPFRLRNPHDQRGTALNNADGASSRNPPFLGTENFRCSDWPMPGASCRGAMSWPRLRGTPFIRAHYVGAHLRQSC